MANQWRLSRPQPKWIVSRDRNRKECAVHNAYCFFSISVINHPQLKISGCFLHLIFSNRRLTLTLLEYLQVFNFQVFHLHSVHEWFLVSPKTIYIFYISYQKYYFMSYFPYCHVCMIHYSLPVIQLFFVFFVAVQCRIKNIFIVSCSLFTVKCQIFLHNAKLNLALQKILV